MQTQVSKPKFFSSPARRQFDTSDRRWSALSKKIDKLAKDAAKLKAEHKSPLAMNKTVDRVLSDVEQVKDLVLLKRPDRMTYREAAEDHAPSVVAKPVEVAREFLETHPDLPRKEAIMTLVNGGINFATAKTQYQRWFKARQKPADAKAVAQKQNA